MSNQNNKTSTKELYSKLFNNSKSLEEIKCDLYNFISFLLEEITNNINFYHVYELYEIGREKLIQNKCLDKVQLTEMVLILEKEEKLLEYKDFYLDKHYPPFPQQLKNLITRQQRDQEKINEQSFEQNQISFSNIFSAPAETNCQQQDNEQLISQITIQPTSNDLFNQALEYEIDSKLDKAYQIIKNIDITQLNKEQQFQAQVIEDSYNFMISNLAELDSTGWTLDKQSHGISISYKFPPKTSTVSLLMEAEMDADCSKLMALISEVDLFSEYVPFCNFAATLKNLSKTQKVCTSQLYFPVISNRETIFLGQGIDRLEENGTILFLCKSIDQDQTFLDHYNIQLQKTKNVRLQLNYYVFQITPLSRTRCRIKAVNNSNPRLSFVPTWLAALIARKFAFTLVEKMVKYTKNFEKTPWFKKTQENPEFYQWLNQKIDKFFLYQQK